MDTFVLITDLRTTKNRKQIFLYSVMIWFVLFASFFGNTASESDREHLLKSTEDLVKSMLSEGAYDRSYTNNDPLDSLVGDWPEDLINQRNAVPLDDEEEMDNLLERGRLDDMTSFSKRTSESLDFAPSEDSYDHDTGNTYLDVLKRYYRGWGTRVRFPWRRLPDKMCFRQKCRRHRDCCFRWNLCDASAHVCIDCWYGSPCKSEGDCCYKYPYCARRWVRSHTGKRVIASGKCVTKL